MKNIKSWGVGLVLISLVAILGHLVHMNGIEEDKRSGMNILQIILELTVMAVGVKLTLSRKE